MGDAGTRTLDLFCCRLSIAKGLPPFVPWRLEPAYYHQKHLPLNHVSVEMVAYISVYILQSTKGPCKADTV